MILALILPIALPILAGVCLYGALRPGPLSRKLLIATALVLITFWLWYIAAFIIGI